MKGLKRGRKGKEKRRAVVEEGTGVEMRSEERRKERRKEATMALVFI